MLDVVTEAGPTRFIGHVAVDATWAPAAGSQLTGFENHSGRTYLGSGAKPLGRVLAGAGNNGEDGTEGARYREVYATYLHGPVLPKNPWLADHLHLPGAGAPLRRLSARLPRSRTRPRRRRTPPRSASPGARPRQVAGGLARRLPDAAPAIAGPGQGPREDQDRELGDSVDFSLSAEQRELTEAAADFARRELNQDLAKRDDAGEFPRDAWQACAKFGIQGLPVPTDLGGTDSDVLTTALVMEALGYGCRDNGLLFSLNAQMWSVELPLVAFGTEAQQRAYLPPMVSGDVIGGHAMTEPEIRLRRAAHAHPRRAAR